MAEERINLAPASIYGRSDEAISRSIHRRSEEESSKCLIYVLSLIVFTFAVCLILAQIFLRITNPKIELRSVATRNLRFGNSSRPYFNATLVNEIAIKNPNFGCFEFGNSSGTVVYKNVGIVGVMKIVGGRVEARRTVELRGVEVEITSSGLSNSTNLSSDLGLGFLELRSVAEIKGMVDVIGRRRWKIGEMSCTMKLNLTGRFIQDLSCE